MSRSDRKRPGGDKKNSRTKQFGKTWVNAKGEILIYHNGREYNISNWEILEKML